MYCLLLAALLLGPGEPGPVTIETLAIAPEALNTLPRAEVKVEIDGRNSTYSGVPLAAILAKRSLPIEGMPGLRDLADAVILLRATDGYQVAVSAAEVAMDSRGERFMLATSRNGQSQAPQLIIPADPKRVRWIRDVNAVRLVRLDQILRQTP